MSAERREWPGEIWVGHYRVGGAVERWVCRDGASSAQRLAEKHPEVTVTAYVPKEQAEAQVVAVEAQVAAVEAKLAEARYLGDNHHSALAIFHPACPHCRPELEAERAKQRELVERAEQVEQQLRERLLSDEARNTVVDFLGSWRYCPVSRAESPARSCLEDAATQLLTALAASSSTESTEGQPAAGVSGCAAVCFSGGPLDQCGGEVDLSHGPIHLNLPWERGSYVFAGTENDGEAGWFNYEWKPLAEGEAFPDGPQALVTITEPARELRRVWDGRVRFLLERAREGIDADAEALELLLDGVDHPARRDQGGGKDG